MSQAFTVYQATNPATPPETLAEIARRRADLRQFVAANPATPPAVVEWLGGLGDYAVDAALARRRPAAPAGHPHAQTQPHPGPRPPAGAPAPVGGHPGGATQAAWVPTAPHAPGTAQHAGAPGPQGAPPGHLQLGSYGPPPQPLAGTNPYAAPAGEPHAAPRSAGYGPGAPVTGLPQDAYGYQLPSAGGRRTGLVVAIVIGALLLVGALVFAATTIFGAIDTSSTYGDDSDLDRLWERCAEGSGQACDDLYMESPIGSGYEEFGDTCGNRRPPGEWCAGRI